MTTTTEVGRQGYVIGYLEERSIPIPKVTGRCPDRFAAAGELIECRDMVFKVKGFGGEHSISGQPIELHWVQLDALKIMSIRLCSPNTRKMPDEWVGWYDPFNRRASFCQGPELHPGLLLYHFWVHGYMLAVENDIFQIEVSPAAHGESSDALAFAFNRCHKVPPLSSPVGFLDLVLRSFKPECFPMIWQSIAKGGSIDVWFGWPGICRLLTYTALFYRDVVDVPWSLENMPDQLDRWENLFDHGLSDFIASAPSWQDAARVYGLRASIQFKR